MACASSAFGDAPAPALQRYAIDADEVATLDPGMRAGLEHGEALAQAGKYDEALAAFHEAAKLGAPGPLLLRRTCEAATVLGRHEEAVDACHQAMSIRPTQLEKRATVRALLGRAGGPSPRELAEALGIASLERHKSPQAPWGHEMMYEIAMAIGDDVLAERCLLEMQQMVPNDPATARLLAARRPHGAVWFGWLMLAGLVLGTLGHAFWGLLRRLGWRRGSGHASRATIATVLVAVQLLWPGQARAEGTAPANSATDSDNLSDWAIDENDPEKSVPSEEQRAHDPLQFGYWLQDVVAKAGAASKRGDHVAAIRYYRALVKAVPDRAISYTQLCREYEAINDWDHAAASCGAALLHDGLLVNDYVHFLRLMAAKPGPLVGADLQAVALALQGLRADPNGKEEADALECDIGVKTANVAVLETCSAALAARAPNDAATLSYEWSLAMLRKRYGEARDLIARAQAAGLPDDKIQRMTQATDEAAGHQHKLWLWGTSSVVLLVAAAVVFVRGRRRRRDDDVGVSLPVAQGPGA